MNIVMQIQEYTDFNICKSPQFSVRCLFETRGVRIHFIIKSRTCKVLEPIDLSSNLSRNHLSNVSTEDGGQPYYIAKWCWIAMGSGWEPRIVPSLQIVPNSDTIIAKYAHKYPFVIRKLSSMGVSESQPSTIWNTSDLIESNAIKLWLNHVFLITYPNSPTTFQKHSLTLLRLVAHQECFVIDITWQW